MTQIDVIGMLYCEASLWEILGSRIGMSSCSGIRRLFSFGLFWVSSQKIGAFSEPDRFWKPVGFFPELLSMYFFAVTEWRQFCVFLEEAGKIVGGFKVQRISDFLYPHICLCKIRFCNLYNMIVNYLDSRLS